MGVWPGAAEWEQTWAPYDKPTYRFVEEGVRPGAIVLDIGAGDLRLARRLAARAARVYAVEMQLQLMTGDRPDNLHVVCADAREWPFPPDIDTAVLLMRHCRSFGLYYDKLAAAGCRTLFTNARWRMGVERIDFHAPRIPFDEVRLGWYACRCGATGFRPGSPEGINIDVVEKVHEVSSCPECKHGWNRHRLA